MEKELLLAVIAQKENHISAEDFAEIGANWINVEEFNIVESSPAGDETKASAPTPEVTPTPEASPTPSESATTEKED